eukprot:2947763-Rhodomonas_salina.2
MVDWRVRSVVFDSAVHFCGVYDLSDVLDDEGVQGNVSSCEKALALAWRVTNFQCCGVVWVEIVAGLVRTGAGDVVTSVFSAVGRG